MKRFLTLCAFGIVSLTSTISSAQLRQDKLFVDDGTGKFVKLVAASLAAGRVVTIPDAGGASSTALSTGTGSVVFTGPTAQRSYALPDASSTILTTANGVQYGTITTQATTDISATNYLADISYSSTVVEQNALGARITSTNTATTTNRNATALTLAAAATTGGTATGLEVSATGGATQNAIDVNSGALKITNAGALTATGDILTNGNLKTGAGAGTTRIDNNGSATFASASTVSALTSYNTGTPGATFAAYGADIQSTGDCAGNKIALSLLSNSSSSGTTRGIDGNVLGAMTSNQIGYVFADGTNNTTTDNITKTAVSITSTGGWTGATNAGTTNTGLTFNVTGGTTNTDIAGTSSNWKITSAGAASLASATTPTIVGGSAVGSTLTLQSTSAVGTTDAINMVVGNNGATQALQIAHNGTVGIGSTQQLTITNGGVLATTAAGNAVGATSAVTQLTVNGATGANAATDAVNTSAYDLAVVGDISASGVIRTTGDINTAGNLQTGATTRISSTGAATLANVTTSGHLISTSTIGATPAQAGSVVVATTAAVGSDLAGSVQFDVDGSGAGSATVSFGTTYTTAPTVVICPGNGTAADATKAANIYVDATGNDFTIHLNSASAGSALIFNYIVVH